MNFSQDAIERQLKRVTSSRVRIGTKAWVIFLRVLIVGILAAFTAAIFICVGAYRCILDNSPDISDISIMPLGYVTFAYDADGNEMQQLTSASGNRISVSISEIPEDMQHAMVAIEDARFYEHSGIDPHGMLRALFVAIQSGFSRTEGASTITQQLLKNNVFSNWTSESRLQRIERKLQEQFLAVQLEESLTKQGENAKEIILENYLNSVNFGAGCYGVQTAAKTYFGKDVKDLTLSECAVLAAIPQNPTRWNPQTHPENNASRAKTVLSRMLDQGYITKQQYESALEDNVYTRIQENYSKQAGESHTIYSYFVDELIDQVQQDLMDQKGYTREQAASMVYSGGLSIYSTEDPNIQSIMEDEFSDESNFPSSSLVSLDWALTVNKADGSQQNYSAEMLQSYFKQTDSSFNLLFSSESEGQKYIDQYKATVIGEGDSIAAERTNFTKQPQAAMTVIDQKTGYVKGIVGGRGQKTASLTLNRASDTYRQPGSTFKILSTYGPALDTGKITLATEVEDEPYTYKNGQSVMNADKEYHGTVTVRTAITNSYNIVAVKVLTDITPRVGFDYLMRLGFTKLVDDENYDVSQPLALGGITNGVSTVELTAAYAAIANGGNYIKPMFYTKVTDHAGNVILENTPITTQVFKDSTAYLLTSAMLDVVSDGTGRNFALDNMTLAGKTGTASDYRDLVFAGFTPYYTAAIWAGSDIRIDLDEQYRTFHQQLYRKVMNRIHEGLADKNFEVPDSVEEVTICNKTGKKAVSSCYDTRTEYFAKDNEPENCPGHTSYRRSSGNYGSSGYGSGSGNQGNGSSAYDPNTGLYNGYPYDVYYGLDQ